jgi:hypothetical protein
VDGKWEVAGGKWGTSRLSPVYCPPVYCPRFILRTVPESPHAQLRNRARIPPRIGSQIDPESGRVWQATSGNLAGPKWTCYPQPFANGYKSRCQKDSGRAKKRICAGVAVVGTTDFPCPPGGICDTIPLRTSSSVDANDPQAQCQCPGFNSTWADRCPGAGCGRTKRTSPFASVWKLKCASYFSGTASPPW